jgi:L-fuconolactonase
MRIDSHQHFWHYNAAEYPWIGDKKIARDFVPKDLETELKPLGLDGSVAVQARQSVEESRWLLKLAEHDPIIKGVVGWVDLRSPRVEEELAELAKHPRFVGVRHVVQDEPDANFMLQPDFLRGIGKLKQFGLVYDVLIFPKQLPAAIELAKKFPEQTFVLDHIAKPFIKDGTLSPWDKQIRELARNLNILCKVSGMVTEARHNSWKKEDFRPYLDVVFEAFGVERLMYGSDWPVCLLSGSYAEVFGLVRDYVGKQPPMVRDKVFGENAARAYRLRL